MAEWVGITVFCVLLALAVGIYLGMKLDENKVEEARAEKILQWSKGYKEGSNYQSNLRFSEGYQAGWDAHEGQAVIEYLNTFIIKPKKKGSKNG